MRSSTCGSSQPRRRGRGGLHRRVLLGYEQEEEDGTDKRALDVSQRGERTRLRAASADWAGPIRDARIREARLPFDEAKWASKGGATAAFGPKAEKKEDFYFLFLF
jgi:hypothetical protein